jgi:hypothetical protein
VVNVCSDVSEERTVSTLKGDNVDRVDAEAVGKVSHITDTLFFPTSSLSARSRLSDNEDGGSKFLRNVGTHIYHTAYKPKGRP